MRRSPPATAGRFWSKLKQGVSRARADTSEALSEALEAAVASVTASDVAGWVQHCGYGPQIM